MPKDNLLKEAIADAKAVRDTAVANARLQLEEAFKPHLASMLSTRLRNEAENIHEDNDGSSEIGTGLTVDEPAPKQPSKKASDSSHIENKGLEQEDMGEGDTHKKPIKEAGIPGVAAGVPGVEEEPIAGIENGAEEFGAEAGLEGGLEGDGMADTPDELDLEAIIRELEADLQGAEGMGAPAAAPVAAAPAPAPVSPEKPVEESGYMVGGGVKQDDPTTESFKEAMAGKEVDGSKDGSLCEDAEGVFKDGKSPTAVDGVNGGKKVSPGQKVTGTKAETMTEGEEVDLDEILREVQAEADAVSESTQVASENVELKRSLREHREVIQFLRGKLQEVNMLNAKLLFTNRLFKSYNLVGEQKMRIVETFDRATTLREVKLIYTTLAESLSGKMAGSNKKSAKAITEGLASKPVGSTKPAAQQNVLTEGTTQVARWQKIAGIIKS